MVRSKELTRAMVGRGLRPVRIRYVQAYPDLPASRILIEVQRANPLWLNVEPPLIVHVPGGGFTPEVRTILGESIDDAAPFKS